MADPPVTGDALQRDWAWARLYDAVGSASGWLASIGGMAVVIGLTELGRGQPAAGLLALGLPLLLVGGWQLLAPSPYGRLACGLCFGAVGASNIAGQVRAHLAGGEPSGFWLILGLLQLVWAAQWLAASKRDRALARQPRPDRERIDALRAERKRLRSSRAGEAPDVAAFTALRERRPVLVRARLRDDEAWFWLLPADELIVAPAASVRWEPRLEPAGRRKGAMLLALPGVTLEASLDQPAWSRLEPWLRAATAAAEPSL